ncbi:MAG TPA: hypothetical protein DDZ88_27205 [Verrucomicrobiales bacterium]|nr:hypothetical protein [Verrucomicrobiales bacterium]
MNPKQIHRWRASTSLSSDFGTIAFEFNDGSTTPESGPIPSARLTAIIAVLESSPTSFVTQSRDGTLHVSNSPNTPGLG